MNPRNAWFVGMLLAGLGLDQATKVWVWRNLEYGNYHDQTVVPLTTAFGGLQPGVDEISIIPGWFSLVHARNTGAAFSTMEGQLPLFLVFTAIATVVLLDLARRQDRTTSAVPAILGVILAGVLGNGIDRLRLAYVVDFLKVFAGPEPLRSFFVERFGTHIWPIFNVADSLLVCGVITFIGYFLLQREGEVADEQEEPATTTMG